MKPKTVRLYSLCKPFNQASYQLRSVLCAVENEPSGVYFRTLEDDPQYFGGAGNVYNEQAGAYRTDKQLLIKEVKSKLLKELNSYMDLIKSTRDNIELIPNLKDPKEPYAEETH